MRRRILRKDALVVAVAAVSLILSGCFWTADNAGEGGIALKIDASEIGGSGVGASQMVGSQESPSDSFVIAFVIADDLLRGDPTAAVRAIDELESAISNAVAQVKTAILKNDIGSVDFSDLDVENALPAIQSQTKVLSGTSGSNTFRDLKADREYLVVVYGVAIIDGDERILGIAQTSGKVPFQRMGFTTTTIESGETKTVSLSLDENRDSFNRFLADSYNLAVPPGVRVNLVPIGKLSDVPKTLFYDVVIRNDKSPMMISTYSGQADSADISGTLYVVDFYSAWGNFKLDTPPLSKYINDPHDGELVGKRNPLPSNNRIEIAGVERGDSIRLIITDQQTRGTAPNNTDSFVIGISDAFVFDNGQGIFIRMYEWVAGEYDATDSTGVMVNLVRKGRLSDVPETLYYDVIKLNEGASKNIIEKYYENRNSHVVNFNKNWTDDTDPINIPLSEYTNGPHDGTLVGKRELLPSSNRIENVDVGLGARIRLIITDQQTRGTAPNNTDSFVIGVSDSFLYDQDRSIEIEMYEWVAGQ